MASGGYLLMIRFLFLRRPAAPVRSALILPRFYGGWEEKKPISFLESVKIIFPVPNH
jgi:hypothetical protein